MIIGEYKQKIGDKSRVAFPKKFREELGDKLILSRGYEGCLIVMSPAQWEEMTRDSVSGPFVSGLIRDTRRFLFAGAVELILDAQGRFVIPANLRDYASLSDESVFLGLGNWVEVWSQEKWNVKVKDLESTGTDIATKLSDLKIKEK